jgi:hypothetical protein
VASSDDATDVTSSDDATDVTDEPVDDTVVVDPSPADPEPLDEAPTVEVPHRSGHGHRRRSIPEGDRAPRRPLFEPARRPGRRVTRVVRRVQLWSVFKVVLFGSLIGYVIFLIAAALGWSIANSTGQIHHIEKFMRDIGFDNWSFEGPKLFKAAVFLGAVGVVTSTVLITLCAAITNLISELTGGIRFTVLEVDEADDDELVDSTR